MKPSGLKKKRIVLAETLKNLWFSFQKGKFSFNSFTLTNFSSRNGSFYGFLRGFFSVLSVAFILLLTRLPRAFTLPRHLSCRRVVKIHAFTSGASSLPVYKRPSSGSISLTVGSADDKLHYLSKLYTTHYH